MSLSDLAALGSFVSGVAVLVSLVYLALQVRQAKHHMAAQISQARTHFGAHQNETWASDPELADLLLRGFRGETNLSDVEGFRYSMMLGSGFIMMEDEFRQYKAGLISEELHRGFLTRMARGMWWPGYRAIWRLQRDGFEPDFQAQMDALMEQGRALGPVPDLGASLRAVVAEEVGQQSR